VLATTPAGCCRHRLRLARLPSFSSPASGLRNLAFASVTLKPAAAAAQDSKTLASVLRGERGERSRKLRNWGCAMTFASHFAVMTDAVSGVWGHPDGGRISSIYRRRWRVRPLLAFMIGNAAGSIFSRSRGRPRWPHSMRRLVSSVFLRMLLIRDAIANIGARHSVFSMSEIVFCRAGALVAGGTVPLVLKCTKRLYTADPDRCRRVRQTRPPPEFSAGASQPVIGLTMGCLQPICSRLPNKWTPASIGDSGYSALIGLLLLMSLPGIVGPILIETQN